MAKTKRKAVKERKVKEKKETKNPPNPSPSQVGLGQEFQLETVAGTPAATVTTEEGAQVQVGQVEQAELNEQIQNTQQQQQQQQQEAGGGGGAAKAIHPTLGTVFESNVTKYKNRKTEFLTLPMNLTKQPRYPFKGSGKQKARITLTEDGNRLIVERLQ